MVGDTWGNDVLGARGAGLRAVWFNPGGEPAPLPGFVPELRALAPVEPAMAVILAA